MKYGFTGVTKELNGVTLQQIIALESFGDALEGDIGGWIEKESNLSQEGDAWVYGDAQVSGNARVFRYAQVYGNAQVYGDARVN